MIESNKKSKRIIICLVLFSTFLLVATAVLAKSLAYQNQLANEAKGEQQYWEEIYYRQNVAFALPNARSYQPYTMLRDGFGEVDLFLHICYYNYQAGGDLELKEVFDYLACYYQVWPVTNTPQIDYNHFPRIKAFVDFMYPEFTGYSLNSLSYYEFLSAYMTKLNEIKKDHPEFSEYEYDYVPLELIEEITHNIYDPDYEMDLELSDYRYYRFLTPDAYKTGRANQEIYDEK